VIGAQQVIDVALEAAARLGGADETIVLVGDRVSTSLRWANNSMTTNGLSTARGTTVISIVRQGDAARVGTLTSAEVDSSAIQELVAASQAAAASAPEARDAAPLLSGNSAPADWDVPIPVTGPEVFSDITGPLARGFQGADQLYGFAQHALETTFLATSSGLRRRYTQPTGSVEINAKRDGASAWVGVGTPDFAGVPTASLLEQLSMRLGWAERRRSCRRRRWQT
jgi:predicted Zn-dependent protease